jgi:hypothetical protein
MTDSDPSDPQKPSAKTYADSGWGIKPDDQPSNTNEAGQHASSGMQYDPTDPAMVDTILRAQRRGFNIAAKITVAPGITTIFDLNGDGFQITGLSYGDENLIELLKILGAGFDPRQLRQVSPDDQDTREYTLSRSWTWGAERSG